MSERLVTIDSGRGTWQGTESEALERRLAQRDAMQRHRLQGHLARLRSNLANLQAEEHRIAQLRRETARMIFSTRRELGE